MIQKYAKTCWMQNKKWIINWTENIAIVQGFPINWLGILSWLNVFKCLWSFSDKANSTQDMYIYISRVQFATVFIYIACAKNYFSACTNQHIPLAGLYLRCGILWQPLGDIFSYVCRKGNADSLSLIKQFIDNNGPSAFILCVCDGAVNGVDDWDIQLSLPKI